MGVVMTAGAGDFVLLQRKRGLISLRRPVAALCLRIFRTFCCLLTLVNMNSMRGAANSKGGMLLDQLNWRAGANLGEHYGRVECVVEGTS